MVPVLTTKIYKSPYMYVFTRKIMVFENCFRVLFQEKQRQVNLWKSGEQMNTNGRMLEMLGDRQQGHRGSSDASSFVYSWRFLELNAFYCLF